MLGKVLAKQLNVSQFCVFIEDKKINCDKQRILFNLH